LIVSWWPFPDPVRPRYPEVLPCQGDAACAAEPAVGALSRDEDLQAFATFSAGLLAAYKRYLNSGEPDLVRDGVSYSMNALWLSEKEYADLLADVARIIAPRAEFRPGPGRRRRLVTSAFIPVPEQTEGDVDDHGDRDR
jgi:hypothetical protein